MNVLKIYEKLTKKHMQFSKLMNIFSKYSVNISKIHEYFQNLCSCLKRSRACIWLARLRLVQKKDTSSTTTTSSWTTNCKHSRTSTPLTGPQKGGTTYYYLLEYNDQAYSILQAKGEETLRRSPKLEGAWHVSCPSMGWVKDPPKLITVGLR